MFRTEEKRQRVAKELPARLGPDDPQRERHGGDQHDEARQRSRIAGRRGVARISAQDPMDDAAPCGDTSGKRAWSCRASSAIRD